MVHDGNILCVAFFSAEDTFRHSNCYGVIYLYRFCSASLRRATGIHSARRFNVFLPCRLFLSASREDPLDSFLSILPFCFILVKGLIIAPGENLVKRPEEVGALH